MNECNLDTTEVKLKKDANDNNVRIYVLIIIDHLIFNILLYNYL